ncbi:MAG: 23S rRNA pseudouridine1911/1915/1917 synthase [Planctomycetota bacterium]|jgi:23S rRNA pseudouridine1911/1915/1917 synthase
MRATKHSSPRKTTTNIVSTAQGSPAGEEIKLTVPKRLAGQRLDEVLVELLPSRTRSYHQKLVRRGRVWVNGKRVVRSNVHVAKGDALLLLGLEARREPKSTARLRILHEDETIAVIDKPAGIVTHRNDKISGGTLADLAVEQLGRLPVTLGDERPGIVHRLDRETSGVLVIGRTEEAMLHLQEQFRSRSVEKTYVALAHGVPTAEEFVQRQSLTAEEKGADRQRVSTARGAKEAETTFQVRERLGSVTLIECHPHTGRRHQIRVHLAHAGHPIVDDRLYEPEGLAKTPAGAPRPGRHALHAASLELTHPKTSKRMRFEAPLPRDLEEFAAWLRKQSKA